MNNEIKAFLRSIGSKGGKAVSEAKRQAAVINIAKARAARKAKQCRTD